jgi:hypothetical protein
MLKSASREIKRESWDTAPPPEEAARKRSLPSSERSGAEKFTFGQAAPGERKRKRVKKEKKSENRVKGLSGMAFFPEDEGIQFPFQILKQKV